MDEHGNGPDVLKELRIGSRSCNEGEVVRVEEVHLTREELENFRGRFFLLVDQSGDGCWPWLGPRHSSGAGRYLWRAKDGGNDRYVAAHRVAYYLCTGELPKYLRNLCGNRVVLKA